VERPETRTHQVETVLVDGMRITVVDSVGIGDTKMSGKQVFQSLIDACHSVVGGFNQVLFVTSGKFTKEEVTAYNILRYELFPSGVVRSITIVRTSFPKFLNPQVCEEDKQRLKKENPELNEIICTCNKVIHVNNLTSVEEPSGKAREDSHLKMFVHLVGCCTSVIQPYDRLTLQTKAINFMTEEEKVEVKKKQEMERQRLLTKITVTLHSYRRGARTVSIAIGGSVQDLINAGVVAFRWHHAHIWFGRKLNPNEVLDNCHLKSNAEVLFTQDFSHCWTSFGHYQAVLNCYNRLK